MSIPLLDQVRTNTINDTNVLRGVASDILNCSSILLGSGLSVNASAIRRNSHNSNIRNTIYSSASLLSLIRALESTTTTIKVENSAFNLIVSHQPDMQLGETQVQVPSSLLSSDNIDFTLVTYSSGIDFELLPDSNTTGLRSAANIVELRRLVDGEYDPLSELQNPIILSFPFFNNLTIFNSNFTQNFTCRYYNTTTSGWRTNGCKLVGKDDKFITCSCDHTTSFSAFVEYYPITTDPTTDPNNPTNSTSPTNKNTALKALDSGLVIFKIVISGILLLLIVSVMVGLIIFRKMQPVKSRYIFPFVGLIALFVDLAFTGIASKAATINVPLDELVSSNNTPNIINSISLVVTTSLTAVAICSYMVVCIRYIMYRYYYQWMSAVISQKLEKATSRGIRLFKNNTILLVSVFALGISIIAYFVMLVILRRTDQMNAKQFSYSSSISHFLIMISFLIVIGIVYMIDLIMDFRTRQISDELHDISNEINSTQQNTKGTMVTTFKKENTAFVASAKLKQLFGKNSAPSKIYH
ncbi:predicted protein [Naegleria gruberi]|uniref:Predicted protein n=1 Tax=Naegleria gruberi TaxID=5762 RepID=D2VZT2_NAEGR|nr:uncharacterized protein NAEGRDRAFT_74608 [Naegleria gruberi]EFC37583.1 predicted protein [Naegleria gruberi]|eukprot:XP_002670327.1 predicted protein [Naegleria gruberi strain NEG-M]